MRLINLVALVLVFVVSYNFLFFRTPLGIGIGLEYLSLTLFFFLTRNKETKNLDLAIGSSTVAIFFAFLSAFRGNEVVQFIDLLQALIFSTIALFFYKYQPRFKLSLPNFLLLPLSSALESLSSLLDLLGEKDKKPLKPPESVLAVSIITGGFISLVLVGILFWLLTRGDLVFGQIVNNFFSTVWERLVVSILIFIVLMSLGLSQIKKHFSLLENEPTLKIGKLHELAIILGSITSLFAIFIGIQFRYLFLPIGETELQQIGINGATYSEYVRAGFTELLVAATIVLCVVVYVARYIHQLAGKQKIFIQILTTVLTVENGLILVSAAKRLFLYTDAHGITRAREFGFVFLIWLSAILIILLISNLHKISKSFQARLVLGLTVLVLITINLVNLDGLIATKYPPTVNKEVDYYYLMTLSDDGSESWVPAITEAQKLFTELSIKSNLSSDDYRKFTLARLSLEKLYRNHIKFLKDKYGPYNEVVDWYNQESKKIPENVLQQRKWQSFNLSEYLAYQYIRDRKVVFGEVPQLLNDTITLDRKFDSLIKQETRLDRATEAPLIMK